MGRADVLVTAEWAEQNLDNPNIVFVEVDEDITAYDGGHIEGAVKLDWKKTCKTRSGATSSIRTSSPNCCHDAASPTTTR